MPAHERSFSDPLPDRLYLDTDILIAYLFTVSPRTLPPSLPCYTRTAMRVLNGRSISDIDVG